MVTSTKIGLIGRLIFLPLLLALVLLGCEEKDVEAPAEEELKENVTAVVLLDWLECDECGEAEMVQVLELGPQAIPLLISALRVGPSAARAAKMRFNLEERYFELQAYAEREPKYPLEMDLETFVETYYSNYSALYRLRAAEVLAAFGGEEADQALREAYELEKRPDVRKAIGEFIS